MTAASFVYSYRCESVLDLGARMLGLQTAGGQTPVGRVANPRFFTGTLVDAAGAAAGLQAVAWVARARYHRPTPGARRDPVVTCNGDRLRFEAFSDCGGVYARLDVLSEALDGEVLDRGTTNVDVNEDLRRMLARVSGRDGLRLEVGPDDLTVTTTDGTIVERKVPLPSRWLRGFAEIQVAAAGFDVRAELPAGEAARFLRSLPASARASGAWWLVPAGRSLRVAAGPAPGAVSLAGPHRLEALKPLLRFARTLRVYGPAVQPTGSPMPSAWELEWPGLRLVLVLSPEVYRGFSGEGVVLDELLGEDVEADAELIAALLDFEPRVETGELAERSGLPVHRVRSALAQLGTAGRVGYDLAEAAYFHRELPYDASAGELLSPRLRNARALVAAGAVRLNGLGATVTVGDHEHEVRLTGKVSCTCQWWSDYRGGRGKCKHVLAVQILREGDRD